MGFPLAAVAAAVVVVEAGWGGVERPPGHRLRELTGLTRLATTLRLIRRGRRVGGVAGSGTRKGMGSMTLWIRVHLE